MLRESWETKGISWDAYDSVRVSELQATHDVPWQEAQGLQTDPAQGCSLPRAQQGHPLHPPQDTAWRAGGGTAS